ncbi:MAG: hypothetical protein AAB400_03210 [Patescibacteria group bacterium]
MGKIIGFPGRKGQSDQSNQNQDDPALNESLFRTDERKGISLKGRAIMDKLEAERQEMITQTPPEEIRGYEMAMLKKAGLDIDHYATVMKLLHSLVDQVPPARKKRQEQEYRSLINTYGFEQVAVMMNDATKADITKKPMFYHVLALRIEAQREHYRSGYIGLKLSEKRRSERKDGKPEE